MTESNEEPSGDTSTADDRPLQEGRDYYIENGLMVFTATFLQRRGSCCESGCRHCPFGYVEARE